MEFKKPELESWVDKDNVGSVKGTTGRKIYEFQQLYDSNKKAIAVLEERGKHFEEAIQYWKDYYALLESIEK